MERFLTFFLISTVSSIWWQSLPSLLMIALVGIAALFFLKFVRLFQFTRLPVLSPFFILLFGRSGNWHLSAAGAWVGVLWVASVGHWYTHLQQPFNDYQQTVTVVGTVKSLHLGSLGEKVELQAERIASDQFYWFQPTIRLSWYRPDFALQQGQKVQLQVKLKPIHGLANEHGFHFQQWLFANRISATGYIKSSPVNQILYSETSLRQQLAQRIASMELPHQGWLLAITLGYRAELSQQDWTMLQQTGTAHLVAISGLHVGMVASVVLVASALFASAWQLLLTRLILPLFNFSAWANLRVPLPFLLTPWRWAVVFTFFITLGYAGLAGFSTPTLRAVIMLCLLTGMALSTVYWRPKRLLLLCAFVSVLLMPGAIYTASFWLSFGAVAIIFFWLWLNLGIRSDTNSTLPESAYQSQHRTSSAITTLRKVVGLQLILSVLMTPLVMWQMHTASTVAPLANLLAVPLVSFVILPASLLGTALLSLEVLALSLNWFSLNGLSDLAVVVLQFADIAFGLLIQLLTKLSEWDWQPNWLDYVLYLNGWQWFGLGVALLLLLLPSSPLPRHLALFGLLPAASSLLSEDKAWYVNVFDVGQGTAVLIEKNNQAMLIDTGAAFPSGFSMANAVILPYLRGRQIDRLDWLLVSHSDNDHAGGVPALQKAIPIDNVATNNDTCVAGNSWRWNGLLVEVLWPFSPLVQKSPSQFTPSKRALSKHASFGIKAMRSDNNRSCVIRVSDEHYSVLLPGDIELPAEKQIVRYYQRQSQRQSQSQFPLRSQSQPESLLKADLLVAPHHGSKTSSSKAFIEAVDPATVVFSQGFRNRWQLPHQEVIQRYQAMHSGNSGVELLQTATSGQVKVRISADNVEIRTFRQHIYPYWYAN